MKKIHICHIEITPITSMPRVLRETESAYDAGLTVVIIGEGENFEAEKYSFIGFPHEPSRLKRFFVRSRKMVQAAIETDAEVVQLHSPELLLYVGKLKRNGKKVIFDSHEFYVHQIKEKKYIPKLLRGFVVAIYASFEKFICKRIDYVIYPCTIDGKNYFEKIAKRSLKIENYSSYIENDFTNKRNRSVIYAGALSPERGIDDLAEAVMRTDACLLLCGQFTTKEYEEQFLNKYSNAKVRFLGPLNREELFEQYSKASIGICVLHSVGQYAHTDNMSTKVYEYMQCKLPVIMSDFNYYRRVNDEYNFGICVQPADVCELPRGMQRLFDNPKLAEAMGANGYKAVMEKFNWETEATKLICLYKFLLGSEE